MSNKKSDILTVVLTIYLLAAAILPNILLCFTEGMANVADAVNILLPLGVYMILVSLSARVGRTVWCFFPVIFFGAFEIALLYLFGNSIIAVDMFLNVVTSNPSEMGELLGDMLPIILCICVIYVPLLSWGAIAWSRGRKAGANLLRYLRYCGFVVLGAAIIAMAFAFGAGEKAAIEEREHYNPIAQIFPLNAVRNLCIAVDRSWRTLHYHETSDDFTFNASPTHEPDSIPELYVIVVGETSRAANWQLCGYPRPNCPKLSKREGLWFFPHAMSESNTTHKSVPMMLSNVTAENFDSLYYRHGIITAFKEAGFHTVYLSCQQRNHSFIDFLGEEADTAIFLHDNPANGCPNDLDLLPLVKKYASQCTAGKPMLLVLHTYGSHFRYNDRYPDEYRKFTPDAPLVTDPALERNLINAYDNTILLTDAVLDSVMTIAAGDGTRRAAVVYASDHGEDIFDNPGRKRFLHSSPRPTVQQLHVPMLVWLSPAYSAQYPAAAVALDANRDSSVSTSRSVFHTALNLAGISSPAYDSSLSVASADYKKPESRRFLTDGNRSVSVRAAGFEAADNLYMQLFGL